MTFHPRAHHFDLRVTQVTMISINTCKNRAVFLRGFLMVARVLWVVAKVLNSDR